MNNDAEDEPNGDADLVNGESGCEQPQSTDPSEDHDQKLVLPSGVLIEALTVTRRIRALDAASVPAWLMAEPLELAMHWLELHGRRCQHPLRCTETPGPL